MSAKGKIEVIKNAKYVLTYAKDVGKPAGADNAAVEHFRTVAGFVWFLFRNKAAREAIHAGRFQFITVVAKKTPGGTENRTSA